MWGHDPTASRATNLPKSLYFLYLLSSQLYLTLPLFPSTLPQLYPLTFQLLLSPFFFSFLLLFYTNFINKMPRAERCNATRSTESGTPQVFPAAMTAVTLYLLTSLLLLFPSFFLTLFFLFSTNFINKISARSNALDRTLGCPQLRSTEFVPRQHRAIPINSSVPKTLLKF